MVKKWSGGRPGALIPAGPAKGQLTVVTPVISARDSLLAKNTVRGYVRDWKDFFGVEDLAQVTLAMCLAVTPEQVAAFRDRELEKEVRPGVPINPNTVLRKLSALRVLFNYLIERKLVVMNPASSKLVRPPKRSTVRKMEALDSSEASKFLAAIDRTTPIGRRDYAAIMIDLHMGLRRSEALSIRAEQFKVAQGEAYVVFRSKGDKERMVTVNKDLAEALAEYARDRGNAPGWLFPGKDPAKPLSGDQFWRIVQKYLEQAGITKKVGTHGLRATFITHNLAAGTPLDQIQKTVGHSRGETTLGYARDLEMIKSRAPRAMEGFGSEKEKANGK